MYFEVPGALCNYADPRNIEICILNKDNSFSGNFLMKFSPSYSLKTLMEISKQKSLDKIFDSYKKNQYFEELFDISNKKIGSIYNLIIKEKKPNFKQNIVNNNDIVLRQRKNNNNLITGNNNFIANNSNSNNINNFNQNINANNFNQNISANNFNQNISANNFNQNISANNFNQNINANNFNQNISANTITLIKILMPITLI